jgi:hypothetical protein
MRPFLALVDGVVAIWRRGWDSNPRGLLTLPLFESGTLNHSDTSPRRILAVCQQKCKAIIRLASLIVYARQDSNLRPFGPQPNALSTELRARLYSTF